MKIFYKTFGFFALLALFFSISFAKLKVIVSIDPQSYFVEQIAKDLADVYVITPSNKNPESYEPSISQMKNLRDGDVYFGVGIDFERRWKDRFISNARNLRFIDLLKYSEQNGLKHYNVYGHHDHDHDEEYEDEDEGEEEHDHGHDHGHRHDSHIWLSVKYARFQADKIAQTLQELDPNNAPLYAKNLQAFKEQIDKLDSDIKAIFDAPNAQKTFLVYHPAFEYLSAEYGLKELSIEHHGKEAKPRHLKELSDTIRKDKLKIVYIQPHFSKKQVELIAKSNNLKIGTLDPFAKDWANNLLEIANKIAKQK
ncbi:MAG: zinc ABC transporter substrate-binding protein [Helicobacter sp.]|nr:zinc ABC transporter substrate-binding protein [Helicobacter sp.]